MCYLSEPIRVLTLHTVMDRGGAETITMNYYRHLNRERVQLDFLVSRPWEGAFEKEIRQLGGRVFRMSPLYPQYFHRYKNEVSRFFREHPEYKIVHSNLSECSYFALQQAKKCGVPVRIAHAHNVPRGINLKMAVRYDFRRRLPPYVTHCFACGKEAGDWLFPTRKEDVMLLPNAIDTKEFSFNEEIASLVRKEWRLQDEFVIGHIGRFDKQKNHLFLIKVFAEFLQAFPKSVLVLVGDGKEKSSIQRIVNQSNLNHAVKFLGVRTDVARIIQGFDLFLFPSLYEGFPVTLLEAQVAGLPCVIADTITKDCALSDLVLRISLQKKPSDWADEIKQFIQNIPPRKDGASLVNRAGYDIKDCAGWLENFYLRHSGLE